jgi:hypothetical protein
MPFYSSLFQVAWNLTKGWVVSLSVVPGIILAIIPPIASVIVFKFIFSGHDRAVSAVSWRIARIVAEGLIGLLATVSGMFAISLFYYSPRLVLRDAANKAAAVARAETEQVCRTQQVALSKEISQMQEQIRSNPFARRLVQADRERDIAHAQATRAEEYADRIMETTKDIERAYQRFDQALNRQNDEWTSLSSLSTGLLELKPGVTESEAMAEKQQYELCKSETAVAKSKLYEKIQTLQFIELNR